MPKATKRKKEKKADFQKSKLKLGKGKQAATNATDVSFKARTIALPQQSITSDKSGKLVNSRNLTVADLALQLRHYSANVRRDAVLGIKDILNLHPSLLTSALGQLLPELVRCIGDDDSAVRKQLYGVLSWMLPQVPPPILAPFHNALLLFTTSALSHIYPDVRLDAVKILDLCLDLIPDVAIQGWETAVFKMGAAAMPVSGAARTLAVASASSTAPQPHGERIMNCLLNMLGITQRSSTSSSISATDLTQVAKLTILKSLKTFLVHALSSKQNDNGSVQLGSELTCPTWYFRSSFNTVSEFEYFERLLNRPVSLGRLRTNTDVNSSERISTHTRSDTADYASIYGNDSLMDLEATIGKSTASTDLSFSLKTATGGWTAPAARSASMCLYDQLHPVLLAAFLDTAPSAFQPDMQASQFSSSRSSQNLGLSVPAQVLYELLTLLLTLWRSSTTATAPSPPASSRVSLKSILGHMSIYFPFSERMGSATTMSAKARSLVVQMDLAYAELIAILSLITTDDAKHEGRFNLATQIGYVSAFIVDLLAAPVSQSGTVTLASTGTENTLDPHTVRALLPILWFLLDTANHNNLLDALLVTYHGYSSTHRVKPLLFEFLARVYMLSFTSSKQIKAVSGASPERVVTSLLSTLPRTLWESSNSPSTHHFAGLLLEFLNCILLLPAGSHMQLAFDGLRPFYCFKHPATRVTTLGPFARLPPNLHKLALDNATLLSSQDVKFAAAIDTLRQIIA